MSYKKEPNLNVSKKPVMEDLQRENEQLKMVVQNYQRQLDQTVLSINFKQVELMYKALEMNIFNDSDADTAKQFIRDILFFNLGNEESVEENTENVAE